MTETQVHPDQIYQGQFGEFRITDADRREVVIYRGALGIAAVCFTVGVGAVVGRGADPMVIQGLTPLYALFCAALGICLNTIHIYLAPLHRALQICWLIGCGAAVVITVSTSQSLAVTVVEHPASLWGLGFTFVALTGICFKEAFCFNRLETKLLTPLVPLTILGHLFGIMPWVGDQILLSLWAILFLIFALRKGIQAIPPDIGDKSVFAYLRARRQDPA